MSQPPAPLTWDELDQLADWAAGVLTGAEAERVAHLVHTDPRWTSARNALRAAEPMVSDALRAAAADAVPPAPPDLAARIAAAPLHTTPMRQPMRRQRVRRRTLVAALASVVLLIGGVSGIATIGALPGTNNAGEPELAGAPPPAPPVEGLPGVLMLASGIDYQRDTLSTLATTVAQSYRGVDDTRLDAVELAELATADGLAACVAAVLGRYPGVLRAADFARFETKPAVILRVDQPNGTVVVAVDRNCGSDGDLHELASVEVA